jgi:hypothetical protein
MKTISSIKPARDTGLQSAERNGNFDKRVEDVLHRPFALYGRTGHFSLWGNFSKTGIAANPAANDLLLAPRTSISIHGTGPVLEAR